MIRFILIGLALLATQPISDYLVDRQFKQAHQSTGYTQSERNGMQKLLERTRAKRKHTWSEAQRAAAVVYLWGDGR